MRFDGVPRVGRGSAFAGDAEIEPREASNLRAWAYLSTALEHVNSASVLWRDEETRTYAVSSMWTLLRTALLSYVRTVWLIAPEDAAVRVYRSCVLHEEDVARQREPLTDLVGQESVLALLEGDGAKKLEAEIDHLESLRVRLKARKRGLVVPETDRQDSPSDTAKVSRIARMLDEDLDGEGSIQTMITSSWRNASGHAHGLEWARLSRVEEQGREGVVVSGRLMLDVEGLSMLAMSCGMVGVKALDLFEARRLAKQSVFRRS